MNKVIKSVRKISNGVEYAFNKTRQQWISNTNPITGFQEAISEEVIRNCRLFEITYKEQRWRANHGGQYYFISQYFEIGTRADYRIHNDDYLYESGNYFKTESDAYKVLIRIQCILDEFHDQNTN